MIKRIFSFFLFFIISHIYSQDVYSEVRKKYWSFEENDQRAFIYLNKNIVKAKSEQNHQELFQAYKDAILFSKDKKIEYADSSIVAAKMTRNSDFIGDSYLSKGAIYYFNYREFQFALNEYLKAYEYLKNSKNGFLKYQNLYHIGVIKSYLGYYEEALQIFKECIVFFEAQTKFDLHENLIYNNTKGYLNSLHQAIICYQALGKFDQADLLLKKAAQSTPKGKDFTLEDSYFKKSIGISDFSKGNYSQAIKEFNWALPSIIKVNDFTWASYIYFYRGKSYTKIGNPDLGVDNYKKVDSIFNKYKFILPELRSNYEELITYYKKKDDSKNQLYYTNQLLKVDSVISSDFKYLSTRIHRDYDTKSLLEVKEDLEKTNSFGKILLIICAVIILLLGGLVYYRSRKQKQIQQKYSQLLVKMDEAKETENVEVSLKYDVSKNIKVDKNIVEKLLNDINNFEINKGYLEKGITLKKLSDQFKTNTSYLSQVINEYKGNNFNTYINILRINFATQKIYDDREWRKYSIEHISSASGFSNRQSFSNVFLEQNGIRPVDFIKNRIKETEIIKT